MLWALVLGRILDETQRTGSERHKKCTMLILIAFFLPVRHVPNIFECHSYSSAAPTNTRATLCLPQGSDRRFYHLSIKMEYVFKSFILAKNNTLHSVLDRRLHQAHYHHPARLHKHPIAVHALQNPFPHFGIWSVQRLSSHSIHLVDFVQSTNVGHHMLLGHLEKEKLTWSPSSPEHLSAIFPLPSNVEKCCVHLLFKTSEIWGLINQKRDIDLHKA